MSVLINKFNIINRDNINDESENFLDKYMLFATDFDSELKKILERVLKICEEYPITINITNIYSVLMIHIYKNSGIRIHYLSNIYSKIHYDIDHAIVTYLMSSDRIKNHYYTKFRSKFLFKTNFGRYAKKIHQYYAKQYIPYVYKKEFEVTRSLYDVKKMIKMEWLYNKLCKESNEKIDYSNAKYSSELMDSEWCYDSLYAVLTRHIQPSTHAHMSNYYSQYAVALKKSLDQHIFNKINIAIDDGDSKTVTNLLLKTNRYIPLSITLNSHPDYIIPMLVSYETNALKKLDRKLNDEDKKIIYKWMTENISYVLDNTKKCLLTIRRSEYCTKLKIFIENYKLMEQDMELYRNLDVTIKSDYDDSNIYDKNIVKVKKENVNKLHDRAISMNYEPELKYYMQSFETFYNTRHGNMESKINYDKSMVTVKIGDKIITRNIQVINIMLIISKFPNIDKRFLHTILGNHTKPLSVLIDTLVHNGDIVLSDGKYSLK